MLSFAKYPFDSSTTSRRAFSGEMARRSSILLLSARLHLLLGLILAPEASDASFWLRGVPSVLQRRGGGGGGGGAGRAPPDPRLSFKGSRPGEFKILQVADMHYANGRSTGCLDVFPNQTATCSDLNTTAFLYRVIRAETPDLVVFTGDNIYGDDATDAAKSLDMSFEPAVTLKLPWAAVLGNHDQESTLSREGVMRHIVAMPYTLSKLNPYSFDIDGFGNYNLEIYGAEGSLLSNKSVLNLYFLDSGDYSTVPSIRGYGWIKASQQVWFKQTSSRLQKQYMRKPNAQKEGAPGLAYFHIPLPEYSSFDASNFKGVKQEDINSASFNSGFFSTLLEARDVKAVFTGHDHKNDFCGKLAGIHLCYAGGFGYHAYGKKGWSRRARVVSAYLEKTENGEWGGVESIKTWKRLDDKYLSTIDSQVLWSKGTNGRRRKRTSGPLKCLSNLFPQKNRHFRRSCKED